MRRFLTLVALAAFTTSVLAECKCARPEKGETTRWGGNEMVVVIEDKPYKQLQGIIERDGEPLPGALVEVFTNPEYLLKPGPNSRNDRPKQRKLAACLTRADGKFCFRRLPKGTYELRSSMSTGWNVTHVHVALDKKAGRSEDLDVRMSLGT